jgi:Transposase DDE domain
MVRARANAALTRAHAAMPLAADLYRGRDAIEREFGRLKHQWGLGPIRVRGREKVALHPDLCILARRAPFRAVSSCPSWAGFSFWAGRALLVRFL